jgi:uncharacterized protein (TIGR03790 family)
MARRVIRVLALAAAGCQAQVAAAQGDAAAVAGSSPTAAASVPAAAPAPLAVRVPVVEGRLRAAQLGLVVNDDDPYSVAVGAHYQKLRGLDEAQVLHVRLPLQPRLEPAALQALRQRIDEHFGQRTQALALAWRQPWAVGCLSITSAVTLGWHPEVCQRTCERTPASPYFNHPTAEPYSRLGLRPSMLLAAPDEEQARRLIERGVAADGQLGRRFGPTAHAVLVRTSDAARNVRAAAYPTADGVPSLGLKIERVDERDLTRRAFDDVILAHTGSVRLGMLRRIQWLPGALADHLTSAGGVLDGSGGQSTVLEWIESGATASHGTVSEPCNHLQKFPLTPVLLGHYLQGATAIEAYWKSVAWPMQSLFVGEPLAAPFARDTLLR